MYHKMSSPACDLDLERLRLGFVVSSATIPHDGDPLAFATAAAEKAERARRQRSMPICRWLSPHERKLETLALVSYPRSGNSMLRGMLEKRFGVYTGSDTRPDRTLSTALRDQWGMAGEGVVDPRLVHIVKSHWPERRGWRSFEAQRIILLVRNPFDAIDSYFNMCLTNTHHLSLTEEVYHRFRYRKGHAQRLLVTTVTFVPIGDN